MTAAVWIVLYLSAFTAASDSSTNMAPFSDYGASSEEISGTVMARLAKDWIDREQRLMRLSKLGVPLVRANTIEDLHIQNTHRSVRLGKRLFRQLQATIFSIQDIPDALLKYEINCDSLDEIHPLVREALMLKLLEDSDIAPKLLYLSAPEKFLFPRTVKTDVELGFGELLKCAANKISAVRVIAMEHAGTSVHDFIQEGSIYHHGASLQQALQVTLDLLRILEVLHARGVAHGDIHPGNVVINESTGKVKVIDFGRAFFAVDFAGQPLTIRPAFSYMHCLFSPWNLLGQRFGFRDDLYKAMHLLAVLLMGETFTKYCTGLVTNKRADKPSLLEFKRIGYYFQVPLVRDPVEESKSLDRDGKDRVKFFLHRAMSIARDQPEVDAPARIGEVRAQLEAALAIASGI